MLDTLVHRYLTDSMAHEGMEAFARPVPRLLSSSVDARDWHALQTSPLEARNDLIVASEFSAGGDLFDAVNDLAAVGPNGLLRTMSPFALRDLTADLLAAVATLHRWGIAHRDISPENVLLSVPLPEVAGSSVVWSLADTFGARAQAADIEALSLQLSHGHHGGDALEDPLAPFGAVTAAVEAVFSVASCRSTGAPAGGAGGFAQVWAQERLAADRAAAAAAANADSTIREVRGSLHKAVAGSPAAGRAAAMAAAVCAARAAVARRSTWMSWSLPDGHAAAEGLPASKPVGRRCPEMERVLSERAARAAAAAVASSIPDVESEGWATEAAVVRVASLLFDAADRAAVSMCDGQAVPGVGDELPRAQLARVLTQAVQGVIDASRSSPDAAPPRELLMLMAGLAASGACAGRIQFRLCDFGMAGDMWAVDTEAALPAETREFGKPWFAPRELRDMSTHTALVDEYGVGTTVVWAAAGGGNAPPAVCERSDEVSPRAYGAAHLAHRARYVPWEATAWTTKGGIWDVLCGLVEVRESHRLHACLALGHPALLTADVFGGGACSHEDLSGSFFSAGCPASASERALLAAEHIRHIERGLQRAAAKPSPGESAMDAIRAAAAAQPGGAELLQPSTGAFRCGHDCPASAASTLVQLQGAIESNHRRAFYLRELPLTAPGAWWGAKA